MASRWSSGQQPGGRPSYNRTVSTSSSASLVCESCGRRFQLPAPVRARYPNWTPRECLDCNNGREGGGGRRRAPSGRAGQLTTAKVLERFPDGGPNSGVFTDGSSSGNPGPGGWGVVHVRDGTIVAQRHGSEPDTTNNRMELRAIIEGLEMLSPADAVDIYSDSRLVVDTLTKWAAGWEARGWQRKGGEVKNLALVQRAYALANEHPRAKIQWIRAHDGSRWNEYADALATAHLRSEL